MTELETNGSALVYSTYLGGNGLDVGAGIAVDSARNAYITGRTCSTNFPTTTNAYQLHLACSNSVFFGNAFVTEISAGGSNLLYSSYLGGTNYDSGGGIAVDPAGYVYVAGATASTNFPTFPTATLLFRYLNGYTNGSPNQPFTFDAFVTKFMPSCTNLVYSTYLGGSNYDVASRITCDAAGDAYVIGSTASSLFTNTVSTNIIVNHLTNNLNLFFPVTTNIFLTEINSNGTAILNSAVFGGNQMDLGYGLALDPAGNIFVVGTTISTNFPVTTNNLFGFLRATNSGGSDVFVTAFASNFSSVLYSAYLGGSANDYGYGIAVDQLGNAYVVGQTLSTNFPTLNARQTRRNGTNDAFLAEITLTTLAPVITVSPTNQTVGVDSNATFSVTVTEGTPPFFYQWQEDGTNLTDGTTISGSTISGSTSSVLTIDSAQTNDSGNYSVIVTNFVGSVTGSVSLTVTYFPPYLTVQPTNQTVGVGSTVTFFIDGSASPPFSLQWQKNGIDLTDGTNSSGSIVSDSTSDPLTIRNVQTNDDGGYSIIVTNYAGSVTSSVAILTVVPAPLFGSIMAAGGTNFILSGVGGTNSGIYYVLTSSNLLVPLDLWTRIATNQFDSVGGFNFTNAAQTNAPQMFYILEQP